MKHFRHQLLETCLKLHFFLKLQTSCLNCDGDDPVTYAWTFEPASAANTLESFDWQRFSSIDNLNNSLSIDAMAFLPVADEERYAFVLTGT